MRHGFGHIRDHEKIVEHDLVHSPITRLPGYVHVGRAPATLSFVSILDAVPDQGPTSSCVGNAFSTSVFLRATILDRPIERPSRKLIYDLARLIDGPHREMVDEGSRPAAAVLGMQQYGLVSEERWPLKEETINENAPEDVFQHALEATVGSYYRIKPGEGCSYAIRRALISGFVPVFAMPVDEAYESYDGSGIYEGVKSPLLGSHMQCAIGFGDQKDILVCNSWGDGWGIHGVARVSDMWFDTGLVTDILVPTVVPGGVS